MATKDILMDGDKVCIAWFKKKIKKYILTTKAEPIGGGTVIGAGTYNDGTVVKVEAIPAVDYDFDHWDNDIPDIPVEGFNLGMGVFWDNESYFNTLLANGFKELRIDIPTYTDVNWVNASKAAVVSAIAKGAKVIWGVSSNGTTITSATWAAFRTAILSAAAWAQANGVYEFMLGNEEEFHNDDTTLTDTQLIANIKNVATEVQAIFTRGNISYSSTDQGAMNQWHNAGRGDVDILGWNVYSNQVNWKNTIANAISWWGVDHVYITEFNLHYGSLDAYSTDEIVQATAITEMINYIKVSGMTRALYFSFKGNAFGAMKADGTYRKLWQSLLNN